MSQNQNWKAELAQKREQIDGLLSDVRGLKKALEANRVDDAEKVNLEKKLEQVEALEKSPEFRKLVELEALENRTNKTLAEQEPRRATHPSQVQEDSAAPAKKPEFVGTDEYRKAMFDYLINGEVNMKPESRSILTKGYVNEKRANVTYSGAAGGYLVPAAVENGLEVASRELIGPEALGADVRTVNGTNDRLIRVRDSSTREASWVGEAVSNMTTADLAYGQKELKFHKMRTDTFYISRELAVSSDIDVEADFANQMAYEFAFAQARQLMIGDGVNKPLGLIPSLIARSETVNSATSSTVVADDFLLMMNAVSDMVKMTGQFGFSPGFGVGSIMKMKGNSNLYLFRNQVTGELLPSIHGRPWVACTFIPNTPTTSGTAFGLYGKFSAYKVRYLSNGTTMRRLDQTETAIATDTIGFKAYRDVAAGWCSASNNSTTREAVVGLVA